MTPLELSSYGNGKFIDLISLCVYAMCLKLNKIMGYVDKKKQKQEENFCHPPGTAVFFSGKLSTFTKYVQSFLNENSNSGA